MGKWDNLPVVPDIDTKQVTIDKWKNLPVVPDEKPIPATKPGSSTFLEKGGNAILDILKGAGRVFTGIPEGITSIPDLFASIPDLLTALPDLFKSIPVTKEQLKSLAKTIGNKERDVTIPEKPEEMDATTPWKPEWLKSLQSTTKSIHDIVPAPTSIAGKATEFLGGFFLPGMIGKVKNIPAVSKTLGVASKLQAPAKRARVAEKAMITAEEIRDAARIEADAMKLATDKRALSITDKKKTMEDAIIQKQKERAELFEAQTKTKEKEINDLTAIAKKENLQLENKTAAEGYGKNIYAARIQDKLDAIKNKKQMISEVKPKQIEIEEHLPAIEKANREYPELVHKKVSDAYKPIVNSEVGMKPVDVDDEVSQFLYFKNIKSIGGSTAKSKLSSVASDLILNGRLAEKISSLPTKKNKVVLTVKDTHWLKMALMDYSRSLINSPNSSDSYLGTKMRLIADSLSTKLENTAGTNYKKVNADYRQYKLMEEHIDKSTGLGIVKETGEIEHRAGGKAVIEAIEKEAKGNKDLLNRQESLENPRILAIRSLIENLKRHDFSPEVNHYEKLIRDIENKSISNKKFNEKLKRISSKLTKRHTSKLTEKRQQIKTNANAAELYKMEINEKIRNLKEAIVNKETELAAHKETGVITDKKYDEQAKRITQKLEDRLKVQKRKAVDAELKRKEIEQEQKAIIKEEEKYLPEKSSEFDLIPNLAAGLPITGHPIGYAAYRLGRVGAANKYKMLGKEAIGKTLEYAGKPLKAGKYAKKITPYTSTINTLKTKQEEK